MSLVTVRGRIVAAGLCASVAALAGVPAAAVAAGEVTETPIASAAPGAKRVLTSHVSIVDPLPESAGPHPKACDSIGYLRFRSSEGPEESKRADAVITLIPGFLAGASSFDVLARNVVRDAAKRGKDVEVWGIDRRANCLEDYHGITAAAEAGDASLAYDYYWGGQEVAGKRFEGFVEPTDAGFLGSFGLERTLRDWNTVITTSMPGQKRREKKLVCGGHSLGGPLTASYAGWDFDGDPATDIDAGYRQCAGLVGLDTTLSLSGGSGGAPGAGPILDAAGQSGAAPFVNVSPLTPETIQVTPVFAVGAYFQPQETQLNTELPHTTNLDIAQRVLFSKDAAHFASGSPDIREFTLTNEVVLGGVFDDNSAGLSFLRASLGSVAGGPLADKDFPTPSGGHLALPEDPATPLYSWQRYRQVGAPGVPLELNDSGVPYTSREGEVTEMKQFARALFETPTANFTEQYFPVKILTDVVAAETGAFDDLRYDGVAEKPGLLIQAGDSNDNDPPDEGPVTPGPAPPNDLPASREVVIPGYNHIDVTTAARKQNDGRREPSSRALLNFTLKVVREAGQGVGGAG